MIFTDPMDATNRHVAALERVEGEPDVVLLPENVAPPVGKVGRRAARLLDDARGHPGSGELAPCLAHNEDQETSRPPLVSKCLAAI